MSEMPGITPNVAAFAQRLVDAGFTVAMPQMFGEPGRGAVGPLRVEVVDAGLRVARVLHLGAQPHVADHRLAARARPRPARAVRRPGRRRDRHVLHRRVRAGDGRRRHDARTGAQPAVTPVRRRQGAQARARSLRRRSRHGRRARGPVRARDALHRRPGRSRRALRSTCAKCSATASSRSRSRTARARTRTTSRRPRIRS